jgi:S-adenosylmethionine hydrolase
MTDRPGTGLITLLTDFGESDWFVGAMKGVILSLLPSARVVDISHRIPPGDLRSAAFQLGCYFRFFPRGTVHVVVVDPGVGTRRKIIAVQSAGSVFLAPDNGVLSYVLRRKGKKKVYAVTRRDLFLPEVSGTFHGRDIFAPVAAFLAQGLNMSELGPEVVKPRLLPAPRLLRWGDSGWKGEVVFVDRFGNIITSISVARAFRQLNPGAGIKLEISTPGGRHEVFLVPAYGSMPRGRNLALWGSSGFLELAVNAGDAAREMGLHIGDKLAVRIIRSPARGKR